MVKRVASALSTLLMVGYVYAAGPTVCDKSTLCVGLVSYHDFEEANDSAREDSLNGGNFLLEPAGMNVGRATGKVGAAPGPYAADFSGSNYLKIRFAPAFGDGSYTISFWVRPTTAGSAGQVQSLISNDRANQRGGSIDLVYASANNWTPRFTVYQEDDSAKVVSWGSTITTNSWSLIVVEVNGNTFTGSDGTISISVNGGTLVSTTLSGFIRSTLYEVDFGRRPTGSGDQYFTGQMDQFLQYAGRLSQVEITLLYGPSGAGRAFPFDTN